MFDNFLDRDHLIVAMTDQPSAKKELHYITTNEMLRWNDDKFGIFFTVQGFNKHRKKENLTKINAWAIDIDSGTKEDQKQRIRKSPIPPTCIIESKNGYHCYWESKGATITNFDEIQSLLVEFFSADKNAKDLCRLLRMVNCFHWKDISDPFLVKEVHRVKKYYTDYEMLKNFQPKKTNILKFKKLIPSQQREHKLYEKDPLSQLECKKGLEILSGTAVVNGNHFTFKHNANGTEQIWVDGKSTACWLDKTGRIGSHAKGGPSLVNWLMYYGYDYKGAREIIKDYVI